MIKKVIAGVLVVGVIGAFIAYSVYSTKNREEQSGIPKNAYPVETEEAFIMTIVTDISVKGTVTLVDRYTMYPKSNGKIKDVYVKVGDEVTEGDVLLEYEDDSLTSLYDQLKDLNLNLESALLALEAAGLPASRTEIMQAEANVNSSKKNITEINSSVEQYDISIEQIKRAIETAEKTLANTRTLFESGAASKNELDTAEEALIKLGEQLKTTEAQRQNALLGLTTAGAALSLAEEQLNAILNRQNESSVQNQIKRQQITVDQMRLKIETLNKQISDFTFQEKAISTGTIISRYANPGDYSSAGRALFDIADTTNANLVIKVNIPEKDIANINLGQEAVITGNALGKERYTGVVSRIYPLAEQKQVGSSMETVVTVDIKLEDANAKLKSGYTVDAQIVTNISENTVVVPLMSTLSDSDGTDYVYIMRDDFTVEKRVIELKAYSGMYVEAANVKLGEKIIQSPPAQMTEGMYVKPIVRN